MSAPVLGEHSKLDPPRDERETPCDGRVLVLDQQEPIWHVRCEKCGWEAGYPARKGDPALRCRVLLRGAGLPARFAGKHYAEDDLNAPVLRQLHRWLQGFGERPVPSPAIWGHAGRGKSHLLVSLCERIVREAGVAVMFRSSARLLDELQAGIDTGEQAQLWQRAVTVDVLALDDLGAERPTEWRADRLARLVDERWERELALLIATNVPPPGWSRAFDERTASRLRGMTFPVELGGVDRRQEVIA